MCDCNQKRTMYSSDIAQAQKGMVKVQLLADEPIVLYGDITGRMYVFRNINDINWVDKRDALSMNTVNNLQVF